MLLRPSFAPSSKAAAGVVPGDIAAALATPVSGADRKETAERIAQHFAGQGMAPTAILRAMEPYRHVCNPPMSAVELAEIIARAAAYRGQARRAGIIAPPDMTDLPSGAGWRYTWPAAGLSVSVNQLMDARGGGITAELTIDADLPDVPTRLHGPVRLDILRTSDRVTLARYLADRLPHQWNDVLEAAFRLAIEAHREGAPPVLLSDPLPDGSVEFALPSIARERDVTMIYSKPGQGKSFLALAVALALSGCDVLPMRPPRRYRVAILDWEWERAPHRRRLGMFLGDDTSGCDILYFRMSGSLVGQVDWLRRQIHEHGITYLVIDSIAAACGGDPQEPGPVIAFGNAVRSLGLGSLWIGHVPKNVPDAQDVTAFGSQYWTAFARYAWHVRCESEPGSPVMKLLLQHRKANEGMALPPIGLVFTFADGRVTVTQTDPKHEAAFQTAFRPRDRVMTVLAQGAATVADVAGATGLPKREVTAAVRELAARRMIVELSGDRWGLAAGHAITTGAANGHALKTPAQIEEEFTW